MLPYGLPARPVPIRPELMELTMQRAHAHATVIVQPTTSQIEKCVGCASTNAIRVHYGAPSCHGCKAFFRRSVFEGRKYICSYRNACDTRNESRNRCRACRLRNCIEGGMNPRHVREERVKVDKDRASSADRDAESANEGASTSPPADESQLTQFVCGLERQTEMLSDGDACDLTWCREVQVERGLQNPRSVVGRWPVSNKMQWDCERIMTSADMYSSWYRAFVLHADWAMGIPEFRILSLSDQTALFKQNFMAFGWITYAYKCYENDFDDKGIPLGNGAYIPYTPEEQAEMEEKWSSSYGLVCKKLIDLIVKPMKEMGITFEEYCLLKTLSLFQQDCQLSNEGRAVCIRATQRILEAMVAHTESRFSSLPSYLRTTRPMKLTLLLPSFNHIGNLESTMIQNLATSDLNELSGVPMEIMNAKQPPQR